MMRITADTAIVRIYGWEIRNIIHENWIEPHNSRKHFLVPRTVVEEIYNKLSKSIILEIDAFRPGCEPNSQIPLGQMRRMHQELQELLLRTNKNFRVWS